MCLLRAPPAARRSLRRFPAALAVYAVPPTALSQRVHTGTEVAGRDALIGAYSTARACF